MPYRLNVEERAMRKEEKDFEEEPEEDEED